MKVGNDHYHSMDFKNLKNFKDSLEKLRNIYGDDKNYLISEKNLENLQEEQFILQEKLAR